MVKPYLIRSSDEDRYSLFVILRGTASGRNILKHHPHSRGPIGIIVAFLRRDFDVLIDAVSACFKENLFGDILVMRNVTDPDLMLSQNLLRIPNHHRLCLYSNDVCRRIRVHNNWSKGAGPSTSSIPLCIFELGTDSKVYVKNVVFECFHSQTQSVSCWIVRSLDRDSSFDICSDLVKGFSGVVAPDQLCACHGKG